VKNCPSPPPSREERSKHSEAQQKQDSERSPLLGRKSGKDDKEDEGEEECPEEKVVECKPAKVIEKVQEVEITRVQPVIHRDRYRVELRQVIQPIVEKVTKAPIIDIKTPVTEDLGTRVEEDERSQSNLKPSLPKGVQLGPAPVVESRSEREVVERRTEELPPRIEEAVHQKIIQQVFPIVLKEVVLPNLSVEEVLPKSALKEEDIGHVASPVIIEKLVVTSGVEDLQDRLNELKSELLHLQEKADIKKKLKAEKRTAKAELKAQKQAAKSERKMLKRALQEQELITKTELAINSIQARLIREAEQMEKEDAHSSGKVVASVTTSEGELSTETSHTTPEQSI